MFRERYLPHAVCIPPVTTPAGNRAADRAVSLFADDAWSPFDGVLFLFRETQSSADEIAALVQFEDRLRSVAPHLQILNPPHRTRFVADKLWLYAALRHARIATPDFWSLHAPAELAGVRYPAWLRDPVAYGGAGIQAVDTLAAAERWCSAQPQYRLAVAPLDTRIDGVFTRYRLLLCAATLIGAYALISDHPVVTLATSRHDPPAAAAAVERLDAWLSQNPATFCQALVDAVGLHTLSVDLFLTDQLEPIVFDVGIKLGARAVQHDDRRHFGNQLPRWPETAYINSLAAMTNPPTAH